MVKSTLAGLFGRSPFRPMQKHMEIVAQCAAEIVPLFEALARGDHASIEATKEKIFALEGAADEAKHEIRSNLPKSLLMPVDRRDLLEILHAQDSIADAAQDVAGLLVLKRVEVPPTFEDLFEHYARRVVDAVEKCREIINELDELLEMGFRGREAARVGEMIDELGRIETETDDLGMDLGARLFALDAELGPAEFFLWYELIQRVGDLADFAEDVGDRLHLLMAR